MPKDTNENKENDVAETSVNAGVPESSAPPSDVESPPADNQTEDQTAVATESAEEDSTKTERAEAETSAPESTETTSSDEETSPTSPAAEDDAAEEDATGEGTVADKTTEQVVPLPDFSNMLADAAASSIEMLNDVDLDVKIELGRTELTVEEILQLTEGSVVELDKLAGDPVDILVNEQLVARGEVLVVNDNFCVRINEIVTGVK